MPEKHPASERWGGPGASHENAKKPKPDEIVQDPISQPGRASHVSGGGGERDVHHGHSTKAKRDTEENAARKKQSWD
jgi:hypothetical protein